MLRTRSTWNISVTRKASRKASQKKRCECIEIRALDCNYITIVVLHNDAVKVLSSCLERRDVVIDTRDVIVSVRKTSSGPAEDRCDFYPCATTTTFFARRSPGPVVDVIDHKQYVRTRRPSIFRVRRDRSLSAVRFRRPTHDFFRSQFVTIVILWSIIVSVNRRSKSCDTLDFHCPHVETADPRPRSVWIPLISRKPTYLLPSNSWAVSVCDNVSRHL